MTTTQTDDVLAAIARHAATSRRATDQLRDACVTAVRRGVPIAHVATAAGVARPTVYRWLRWADHEDKRA